MSQKQIRISLAFGVGVLLFAYTNCSQPGAITVSSLTETLSPTAESVASDETVEQVISNCQKALEAGVLLTTNQNVNFDDSRTETGRNVICEFANKGQTTAAGNLEPVDGRLQSRFEQNRRLTLPPKAVICDIEMKNSLQSFRYDDVFFFSFNGYLLASNDKKAMDARLTPQTIQIRANNSVDFFQYDWLKLRTAPFENVADDYCLGAREGLGSCSWPVSEKSGAIKFDFDPALLIGISLNVPADQQTFSFAITGDNDPELDCYHEKLEFAMSVKYYIPQ